MKRLNFLHSHEVYFVVRKGNKRMRKIADGTEVTENQNRTVARERQVAVLD